MASGEISRVGADAGGTEGGPAAVVSAGLPVRSPTELVWLRFRRHRLALFGVIVLAIMSVMAIAAPLIVGYNPNRMDLRIVDQPPSAAHILGTDGNGRDYWARVVYGARVSLSVGVIAMTISVFIGTVLGAISAYYGGTVDLLIQRFTEMVMTFPTLMIIITLVALLGPSIYNVMAVIGLIGWTGLSRLVRGQVLQLNNVAFVEAAHCIGVRDRRVIFYHILPNVIPYIVVTATFGVAGAILTEAGLSFLGLGVQPPTPTWGNLLQASQTLDVLLNKPWRWLAPGIAIALCILSINFLGDGLRDALDPRMQIK